MGSFAPPGDDPRDAAQGRGTGSGGGGHRAARDGVPAARGGAAHAAAAGTDPGRVRCVRGRARRDRLQRRSRQDGGRGGVRRPARLRQDGQPRGHRQDAAAIRGGAGGARAVRARAATRPGARPGRRRLPRLRRAPRRSGDRLRRRPPRRGGSDLAVRADPLPLRAASAVREQADPDHLDGREGWAAASVAGLGSREPAPRKTGRTRRGRGLARGGGQNHGSRRDAGGHPAGRARRRREGRAVLPAGASLLHDADAVEPVPQVGAEVIATLRRSEEGQALVLAAIFGLVLMLCVLGTVNLGRAVYDKVQLQAAADSAAYSAAALEARVMNFTAYTNRAMVVHYASLMAATSYLTWLHFIWAGLRPMLEILSAVPYVGPIAATIQNGLRALIRTLDAGVAALAPLLSAANVLLYGLQEAAWHSVWLRLGKPIQPEAHSGDSAAHPYQPLWPQLLPLANQAVFAQARGHPTMPQNAEESLQMLTGAKTDAVRLARLH